MINLEPDELDYDTVRVFFEDGTSTVIHVLVDESIQDAIVAMCEAEGYDTLDVTDYKIMEDRHVTKY